MQFLSGPSGSYNKGEPVLGPIRPLVTLSVGVDDGVRGVAPEGIIDGDEVPQVSNIWSKALHSTDVTDRSHLFLIMIQFVAYSHQYSDRSGRHDSGPFALLDLFAPAVTAIKCSSLCKSLAYAFFRAASHDQPPDKWAFFRGTM